MPELPEVETVRRGLAPHMEDRVIRKVTLTRPDLRFPFPANFEAALTGARIESVTRRAGRLAALVEDVRDGQRIHGQIHLVTFCKQNQKLQ